MLQRYEMMILRCSIWSGSLTSGFCSDLRNRACCCPSVHPVTVGPPSGERAKPHRSRWSALPDERPWPVGLGLLGLSWGDGDGVNRHPSSATRGLEVFRRPSWSPRSPPEAMELLATE